MRNHEAMNNGEKAADLKYIFGGKKQRRAINMRIIKNESNKGLE